MDIRTLLPRIVLEKDRGKPWQEWVRGTVLFADVSGFTPMSEALSALGAEGAEILTDILNRYFSDMIGIIHRHDGQVMKFGGDAILCFFPGEGTLPTALAAAWRMQEGMGRFQTIRTSVRKFALKMKIGIAEGEVLLAGVGDPAVRCDFIFAGEPVDLTSDAEHHAKPGDIVLADSGGRRRAADGRWEAIGDGFFRLMESPSVSPDAPSIEPSQVAGLRKEPEPRVSRETRRTAREESASQCEFIRPYLIREIHEMISSGYHAQVGALLGIVPVFMKFSGFTFTRNAFRLERFHEFFSAVLELTERHGGRLNRISMGDKGSIIFILFGAPNTLEQKEHQASQWALDLRQVIASRFPEVEYGIGMNSGRVYAGIVGGSNRWEYTVMADAVNVAARLMQAAPPGGILVSGPFSGAAQPAYRFQSLGEREFKGKKESLAVHGLLDRARDSAVISPVRALAGRTQEQGTIRRSLEEAAQGHPSLTIIEGDPGIGKTSLAASVIAQAAQQGWRILSCKGEVTRQNQPYAPWQDLAASLWFDGVVPSKRVLLQALKDRPKAAADLGRLLYPGKKEQQGRDDADGNKLMQWHHRLSGLLLETAGDRRTLLFLDDIHAFDSLSTELLIALARRLDRQPVALLTTARTVPPDSPLQGMPLVRRLPLRELDPEKLGLLLRDQLQGPVRPELVQYVYECTRGNPLFALQLVDGFRQDGYVFQRLGQWTLDARVAKTSENWTGESIILAQLNRLSPRQRHLVQLASCLGTSFSLSILRGIVGKDFSAEDFSALQERQIILPRAMGEPVDGADGFGFNHTLFQEAVYGSLLQKARGRNHRRIAKFLEPALHEDALAEVAGLAQHYFRGGIRTKTVHYGMMAGERYYAAGSFQEASTYYGMALAILGRGRDGQRWNLLARLAQSNLRSGKIRECLDLMNEGMARSASVGQAKAMHTIRLIRCDALQRLGDYGYVDEVQSVLKSCPKSAARKFGPQYRYFLGVAYYRQGKHQEAVACLSRAVREVSAEFPHQAISAALFLGDILKDSKPEEALEQIRSAGRLAKRIGSPDQKVRADMVYGNLLKERGKIADAKQLFLSLLPPIEEMGDYYLMASTCLNLALTCVFSQQWEDADLYLGESLALYYKLGVNNGWAKTKMTRGIKLFFQNQIADAYTEYLEATLLLETLAERHETMHGYFNLAEACIALNRPQEATLWIQKGVALAQQAGASGLLQSFEQLKGQMQAAPKS